ncbi:MAG: hypothetical protein AAGA31_10850 [Bacteroidota bacterium]
MRLSLLMFMGILSVYVHAQVGGSVDAEYADFCMVDSVGVGDVTRFVRLINIATGDVKDFDPVAGTLYTPTGTLITCEQWDLREGNRDPLEDLYADCQCIYTISQEDNKVLTITGGATQTYTVAFQEVVRRQCGGQSVAVVTHRDTLTETAPISSSFNLQYAWTFTATGQYVDQVDVRAYSGGSQQVISIDLNPSTVQASYPSLTLNTADFSWDGSNGDDMALAWETVIDHAISTSVGASVNDVSTVGFSGSSTVSIRTQLMHQPNEPYIILPQQGDSDISYSSTIPGNLIGFGQGSASLITSTSNYTEHCTSINEERVGLYLTWNRTTPLSLSPIININTSPRPAQSTLQAFCDVPPAVCAELSSDPVTLGGECVETCSDVLNVAGHLLVSDEETTLAASTYNSVSILVNAGTVGVIIDGQRVDYPANYTTSWSASNGKLLANSIRIDATASGAEATITYVK